MHSFNLVDERWIPVRTVTGERELLGMRDTLLRARELHEIEDASPLTVAALHRLLLAVLHRALEGPRVHRDVVPWIEDGFPKDRVDAYLERWRDRFDLFHPTHPFYQVPDLAEVSKKEPAPWTVLLPEVGGSNTNFLFNDRLCDDYRPLPAPAHVVARALLTHQAFALHGLISGFIVSAPASPIATDLIVLAAGDHLCATLCWNLVPYINLERDLPVWERDSALAASYLRVDPTESPNGHVQAYTWPSRSILLIPEARLQGTVVRHVLIDSGVRAAPSGAYERDPMTATAYADRGLRGRELQTIKLRPERGFWRDFAALLPTGTAGTGVTPPDVVIHAGEACRSTRQRTKPPGVMLVGLRNNQKKIILWSAERYDLPPAILADRDVYEVVATALNAADASGVQLGRSLRTLSRHLLSHGQRDPHPSDQKNLVRSLPGTTAYWTNLATRFPGLLSRLTEDPASDREATRYWDQALYDALAHAWNETVRFVGHSAPALRAAALAERSGFSRHLSELHNRLDAAGATE